MTTAQRTAVTPNDKDVVYDTDLHKIFIGDGSTVGGLDISSGGSAHNVLSATHTDSLTGSVVAGDMMYGNSTPKWARLAKGSDGNFLKLASGYPAWGAHGLTYSDVGAAASGHNHSGVYSEVGHNHSGVYSEVSHTHSGIYATVIHNFIDTTNHPVTGLTIGHVLTALSATTYGFAASAAGATTFLALTDTPAAYTDKALFVVRVNAGADALEFVDYLNQAVKSTSSPTFANLTITSFAANWTNAGRTVADLGIITTVDINGGTIDGTTIGASTPAAGTFSALTVSVETGGISLLDPSAAYYLKLVSGSTTALGASRTLTFDVDNSSRTLKFSGNPTLGDWFDQSVKAGASPTFVNLTITSFAANWTNAGRTVADLGIITTVDINGGTIDGATIGGASAGAGTFTSVTVDHILEKTASHCIVFDNNSEATINFGIGNSQIWGTSATKTLCVGVGVAPVSSPANAIQFYASDYGADGTGCPTFRDEESHIVKLYPVGATTDLGVVLSNLGLRVAGTAYPITTSGAITFYGGVSISTNDLTLTNVDIATSTSTGTIIAKTNLQKIGFFGTTPVAQQAAATDLGTVLSNLGFRVAGTAYPITTSGTLTLTGTLNISGGTLTLADNQISGDKVEGGTIAAITITALTLGSMSGNWTNAGRTIADLGIVTTGIYTTINATTIHTTTLLADHIGEHEASHTVVFDNNITLSAKSIITDTSTGLIIGTVGGAAGQKLGFFAATPVVQQLATTDLGTVLSNLGLRASGTAYVIETTGICKHDHIAEMTASHTITFDNHITLAKDVRLTTAPGSDHTTSGITIQLVAAQNHAIGDVCRIDSSGQAYLAKADAIANASGICICADATVTSANTGNYMLIGTIRDDTWAWTVGGLIYLTITGTTGNTLSQTAPSAANNSVQIMGVATHADRMIFAPSLVQVERV